MSVAIPQSNLVSILTAQEQREVNAVMNYPRRKLNDLERAIWQLRHVLTLGRDLSDVAKDVFMIGNTMESMETSAILDRLDRATAMTTVRLLAREAVKDPAALQRLVEMYPYVEFGNVINGHLNVYQQMVFRGIKPAKIRQAVMWLHSLHHLAMRIPSVGDKRWFLSTPNTPHVVLRNAIKEAPEAAGLVIAPYLQERVTHAFNDNGVFNHPLQLVQEYQLHKVPDLFKRFDLPHPCTVDHDDWFYEVNIEIDYNYRVGMRSLPVLTASVIRDPKGSAECAKVWHFAL